MSMPDHIKQQVLQEFFPKNVSFSWKTAKLDSFVLPEWENQHTYRKYLTYLGRGSVAHCFNLLHNVRYRTTKRTATNRCQRFESSCNQSVFNSFFSIGSTCSRSLFHLLIFLILRGLLHLI